MNGIDPEYTPVRSRRGGASSKESRAVFYANVSPTLTTRQEAVMAQFEQHCRCTMKQVAERMGVPLHTISGRAGELVAKGLLRRTGVRVQDSEVLELVRVENSSGQVSLFGEAA